MSVNIESILRVAVGVNITGAGPAYEWWGSGASDVARTGVGVFTIDFDESVDPSQCVVCVTPIGSGVQASNAFIASLGLLNANGCEVRIWDADENAADPDGFFFTLNYSTVETDWST